MKHRSVAPALCLLVALSCGSTQQPLVIAPAAPASEFHAAAAGICSKLDVSRIGDRTFIVYGDTGYQLRDWNPGEELAAAQSFVEVRGPQVMRDLSLLKGLPSNAGGYVPGDVTMGGRTLQEAWLLRTTTRYARRGAGALFDHDLEPYTWAGAGWSRHASNDFVQLPPSARSLPDLPVDTLCARHSPDLRFIRVTSTVHLPTGNVWVAGRCQNDSHVNYRPTRIMVAHGAPGATQWEVTDAPASAQLDAIVNLGLYARRPDDLYLAAYEPFVSLDKRVPYIAHYDGKAWRVEHPPMTTGITSISGSEDGTLWAAAGRELWRQDASGQWKRIALPPLPFVAHFHPGAVRITTVHAFASDDVWVGAAFTARIKQSKHEEATDVRGGALYHSRPLEHPLYCDAREPAEEALVQVQEAR
ncbi:MAG: hypothetical protein HY898_15835 [Deltaproteobacteria bacterium]|nr:hypothetical protein [Deltaproteobacteria bacterium]